MDTFLLIMAVLLTLTGIVGGIVPVIPGPPISFLGFLLFMFTPYMEFSWGICLLMGFLALAITLADIYIPAISAKKYGGTKFAASGSVIGMLVGMIFFPPLGVIVGAFLGAFVGEIAFAGKNSSEALKSGWGALIGFIIGTSLKIGYSFIVFGYLIIEWVK